MNLGSLKKKIAASISLALSCLLSSGCLLINAERATPVAQSPLPLVQKTRSNKVSLDLTLLTQEKPATHIIGPGDVLNVYIQGVLPAGLSEDAMMRSVGVGANASQYYPPSGEIKSPGIGIPMVVSAEGTLKLPLIGEMRVAGFTISELQNGVTHQYVSSGIIESTRERIFVSLARSRVHRVLVIREDSAEPQQLGRNSVFHSKRGRAEIVDLPAYENDVLHALAATGGLPGLDARNEVWVLRGNNPALPTSRGDVAQAVMETPEIRLAALESNDLAKRIPLRVGKNEPVPFRSEDVILNEGDILYVPSRNEYFYTAGLLPGGKFPLPRDEDLDVVEAIAMAGGSVGGFGGSSGSGVFRSGGLGAIVPPSLVAITRKLPNGEQTLIRVDLAEAMKNQDERVIIKPGDVVFLHYRTGELLSNMLLNLFNFNFLVNSGSGL